MNTVNLGKDAAGPKATQSPTTTQRTWSTKMSGEHLQDKWYTDLDGKKGTTYYHVEDAGGTKKLNKS